MGSIALDITIGLIFIFLMYSIFASILAEMIATWFGMRARVLRMGITYMLTDLKGKEKFERFRYSIDRILLYYSIVYLIGWLLIILGIFISGQGKWIIEPLTYVALRGIALFMMVSFFLIFFSEKKLKKYHILSPKLLKFFLIEPSNFKTSKAGDFYEHPSLKSFFKHKPKKGLSFAKTKPSYISKKTFSTIITDMLRKQGKGIHDWGKISFSVKYNACHFDPQTHKNLITIWEEADDDMEVFIERLETWYEDTMQRINGWYKRKLRFLIFCMGILISVTFNADTFEMVDTLAQDKDVRNQFLQLAFEFEKETESLALFDTMTTQVLETALEETRTDFLAANNIIGNGWEFEKREEKIPVDSMLHARLSRHWDSVQVIKQALKEARFSEAERLQKRNQIKALKKEIRSIQKTLKQGRVSEAELLQKQAQVSFQQQDIRRIEEELKRGSNYTETDLLHKQAQIKIYEQDIRKELDPLEEKRWGRIYNLKDVSKSEDGNPYFLTCETEIGLGAKVLHILKACLPFKKKFFGILITVLAIYLGAPFWFDLLKKLVAIRGTGINPMEEENKEKQKAKKDPTKTEKSSLGKTIKDADHVDIMIEKHRDRWEAMPGVMAVNKVFDEERKQFVIEVAHALGADLSFLPRYVRFEEEKRPIVVKQVQASKVIYMPASVQAGEEEKPPLKVSYGGSFGTLAGWFSIKIKGKMRKYLLTCGHVLSPDGISIIREKGSKVEPFGSIAQLIWSNHLDMALIDVTDKNQADLANIKQIKSYLPQLKRAELKEANLYLRQASGSEVLVKYVDHNYHYPFHDDRVGTYDQFNLISLKRADGQAGALTKGGDSGALVFMKKGDIEIPLGMIIGGDDPAQRQVKRSYAIPLYLIFNHLGIKLEK